MNIKIKKIKNKSLLLLSRRISPLRLGVQDNQWALEVLEGPRDTHLDSRVYLINFNSESIMQMGLNWDTRAVKEFE